MTAQETIAASWRRDSGKFHLVVDGDVEAVCGRPISAESRTTPYQSHNCYQCERKASEEQLAAAEVARKAILEKIEEGYERILAANRAGRFSIHRCKKCGRQHRSPSTLDRGVAYCIEQGHQADLEQIEVQGPAWEAA